jgi:hypothetical protein
MAGFMGAAIEAESVPSGSGLDAGQLAPAAQGGAAAR